MDFLQNHAALHCRARIQTLDLLSSCTVCHTHPKLRKLSPRKAWEQSQCLADLAPAFLHSVNVNYLNSFGYLAKLILGGAA